MFPLYTLWYDWFKSNSKRVARPLHMDLYSLSLKNPFEGTSTPYSCMARLLLWLLWWVFGREGVGENLTIGLRRRRRRRRRKVWTFEATCEWTVPQKSGGGWEQRRGGGKRESTVKQCWQQQLKKINITPTKGVKIRCLWWESPHPQPHGTSEVLAWPDRLLVNWPAA